MLRKCQNKLIETTKTKNLSSEKRIAVIHLVNNVQLFIIKYIINNANLQLRHKKSMIFNLT